MTLRYRNHLAGLAFCAAALAVGCGCDGSATPVDVPDVDPSAAAQAAVMQYDRDSDGALSQNELASCPGILSVLGKYDTNGDGTVSTDEIAARIEQWHADGVAILSLPCTVTLDGRPLAEAVVRFLPETYLGNHVLPASGITDGRGKADIAIAPDALPADQKGIVGVHCGTYRIEITHPKETIPARYNTQTTLGHEASLDNHVITSKLIALKSK